MSAITTLHYASLKMLSLKMSQEEVLFLNSTELFLIKVGTHFYEFGVSTVTFFVFHRNAAGGNKKMYAIYDTR